MKRIEKLVPDTSVIIEGIVSENIEKKEFKVDEVIIHEAIISELEHQANLERASGFIGLDEIKKIKDLSKKEQFKLRFSGKKPSAVEIKYASLGEIDSLMRELAWEEGATLITADKVQAKVAESKGVEVIYIKPREQTSKLTLEKYFDNETMSVHLKEGVFPYAKKGMPGNWEFVQLSHEKLKQEEIQKISREIIEETRIRKDGFIEIERAGSTIVQLGKFRIVITKPPFSDGWEITAVRPVKHLSLEEYKLSEKLLKRVSEQAEGILIAGAPGHGKSTIATALAEYYALKNKIVKTIEAPRDLILPNEITQYAISHGTMQEIHDILLLSRPDHTIFDEMRNTNDFKLFADLRLAGIGLVGVVHATNPIDAIQRFLGRIELGVVPHVIDTVIFIKNGFVSKVLALEITVKVPSGMTEADLARPLVEVTDFENGKLEYEIYSYGEETVVIPVKGRSESKVKNLASKQLENEFRRYVKNVKVEVVGENKAIVYVEERDIARLIGREGKTIDSIEKELGIGIDVRSFGELKTESKEEKEEVKFTTMEAGDRILFKVDPRLEGKIADIYLQGNYLLSATVSKKGEIRVKKKNKVGHTLSSALNSHKEIRLVV